MKSWLRGLGSTTQISPSARRPSSEADEATVAALSKAEQLFRDLRVSVGVDFPKLNEATKLVHQIEGAVMKMSNQETKALWRSQVEELKRDLQAVTARMLAAEYASTDASRPPSYNPPVSPSPRSAVPRVAVPTSLASAVAPAGGPGGGGARGLHVVEEGVVQGVDLFAGLDMEDDGTSMGIGGDMFSGLDVGVAEAVAVEQRVMTSYAVNPPARPAAAATAAGPAAPASNALAQQTATAFPNAPEAAGPLGSPLKGPAGSDTLGAAPLDADLFSDGVLLENAPLPALDLLSAADSGPPGAAQGPAAGLAGAPLTSLLDMGLLDALPPAPPPPSMGPAGAVAPPAADLPGLPMDAGPLPGAGSLDSGLGPAGPAPRKKKVHKRIGYARGRQDDEDVVPGLASTGSGALQSQASFSTVSSLTSAPATAATGASSAAAAAAAPMPDHATSPGSAAASSLSPGAPGAQAGSVQRTGPKTSLQNGANLHGQAAAHSHASSISSSTTSQAIPGRAVSHALSVGSAASYPSGPSPAPSHTSVPSSSTFEEQLAAAQRAAQAAFLALRSQVEAAEAPEQGARQRLRQVGSRIAELRVQAELHEKQQAEAVEAEDFDRAAQLGSQQDGLKTQLAWLEKDEKAAETACQHAAARRVQLQTQEAELWERAAHQIQQVISKHEQLAKQALRQQEKLFTDLADAESAAAEHLTELRARIHAKGEAVKDQQAALEHKINSATSSLRVEREEVQKRWEGVNREVEELRAALATKEAELSSIEAQVQAVDERIAVAAGKYDKSRTILEEDQAALEADTARLAAEESSVQQLRARQTEAQELAAKLEEQYKAQVADGSQAVEQLVSKAAAVRARLQQEEASRQLLQKLRDEEEGAAQHCVDLQGALDTVQRELKAVGSQRRSTTAEIRNVAERAQRAQRLLPDLEREKKAAAAAKDFAEAKRLADEAKAAAADVASSAEQQAQLKAKVAQLDAQQDALQERLQALEKDIGSSQTAVALARWRRIQAQLAQVAGQVATAEQQESYEEAGHYQAEADALEQEAANLAAVHGFSMSEHEQGLTVGAAAGAAAAADEDASLCGDAAPVSPGTEKPLQLPAAFFDSAGPLSKPSTANSGTSSATTQSAVRAANANDDVPISKAASGGSNVQLRTRSGSAAAAVATTQEAVVEGGPLAGMQLVAGNSDGAGAVDARLHDQASRAREHDNKTSNVVGQEDSAVSVPCTGFSAGVSQQAVEPASIAGSANSTGPADAAGSSLSLEGLDVAAPALSLEGLDVAGSALSLEGLELAEPEPSSSLLAAAVAATEAADDDTAAAAGASAAAFCGGGLLEGLDIVEPHVDDVQPQNSLAHQSINETGANIGVTVADGGLRSEQSLDDLLAGLKLAGTEDLESILSNGNSHEEQPAEGPGASGRASAQSGLLEGLDVMTASSLT